MLVCVCVSVCVRERECVCVPATRRLEQGEEPQRMKKARSSSPTVGRDSEREVRSPASERKRDNRERERERERERRGVAGSVHAGLASLGHLAVVRGATGVQLCVGARGAG